MTYHKLFQNFTIIGMPFSGKTTIGKLLSDKLNYNFIDLDDYISTKYNMKFNEVVSKFGNDEFLKIEEETMLEMNGQKNIFSTGGSVIYSSKGMEHLKNISRIIFLDVDVDELKNRMNMTMEDRGIVFKPGENFESLYQSRLPLYSKYCDLRIRCKLLSPEKIVDLIIKELS